MSERLRRGAALVLALALALIVLACSPVAGPSQPGAGQPTSAASSNVTTSARASGPAPSSTSPVSADPARGRLELAGRMSTSRAVHTATLLPDGRVLLAGGCTEDSCEGVTATTELFDPATGMVEAGPAMLQARVGHGAVALPDGRVLIVGGWGTSGVVRSTELFDPGTATFAAGPDLPFGWTDAFVTLLGDGSVLVAGGFDGARSMAKAVRLDSGITAFAPTGDLTVPRSGHAGTLLRDGRVLLAGGTGAQAGDILASAEVYDPATGTWTAAGDMRVPRHKLAVVTLQDGRALVVGGSDERDGGGRYTSVELFDPATSTFMAAGDMASPRYKLAGSVVVLGTGRVLIAAGAPTGEVFDPVTARFAPIAADAGVSADYSFAPAVPLADGSALVFGGYDFAIDLTDQVLRFVP